MKVLVGVLVKHGKSSVADAYVPLQAHASSDPNVTVYLRILTCTA